LQVAARSTNQAGKIEYFKIPANAQIQDTSEFFTDDDVASVAFWYQTLPAPRLRPLPEREYLVVV
jgi:hypothetical protein